jgi:hypothetical protein
MHMCDMQRAFESQPTELTVNQAVGELGVAVNAAAAVQPAKASHARYLARAVLHGNMSA